MRTLSQKYTTLARVVILTALVIITIGLSIFATTHSKNDDIKVDLGSSFLNYLFEESAQLLYI